MTDLDDLHLHYARVADLRYFDPSQSIWWIYLRAAFGRWLEWNEEPGVRAAYGRLKSFPENLPNERESWQELRAVIGKLLDHGEEGIASR